MFEITTKENLIVNRHCAILAAIVVLISATAASALDQIKTTNKEKSVIRGHIITMTSQEVEIEVSGGLRDKVPVNKIINIFFEDEPTQFAAVRDYMSKGDYPQAAATLEKTSSEDAKTKNIGTEVEYLKALCAARLALGGNGDIAAAGGQMNAFIKTYPNSHHYYEANEILGNLGIAARSYDRAAGFFAELAKAPWPDYAMRANVGTGRALLAQGKTAEAAKAFDEVLSSGAAGDLAEDQRMAAQLGKARCLAAGQKTDQAIKMVEGIIAKADAENADLLAQAYNTLGAALRKAGKNKEAVLAYLHVDLLYPQLPDAHAEALANLAELFTEEHKADHAARMRNTLKENYPNSSWATKGR
jgi:tetratricopeptide (TPR) repeat protein